MDKRCQNCGRYPLCRRKNNNACAIWIKRDIETKLNEVEDGYFEFERLDNVSYNTKR